MTDTTTTPAPPVPDPIYFPVSILKLVIMDLCTFGLYQVYWFYRNWVLIRDRDKRDISAAARAFFLVLFCYPCFSNISVSAKQHGVQAFPSGPLAAAFIIVTISWKLPDPYGLVAFLSVLPLIPVQKTVNLLNATIAPGHDENRRFSKGNIATIVVGGPLFVLSLLGAFLPAQ